MILCLVAFTTGLYAFVFAKIGALKYLSISRDVTTLNICDGAHGAITVALAVIIIVKANENRISYGNTIALNFLLTGLNSFLKNVVNDACLRPFHVRTCECIRLWPYFQSVRVSILSHRNLGSVWLTSWILLRWTNTLIPNRERGAIFDLVGSFGIQIRGDPTCVPLSLKGLSEATIRIPHRICSMWMTCVNAMPVYGMQWNRQNRLESETGEHVFSPELFANGSVYMWLKWRRSSIKSEQLRSLEDLLCWNLKSIDVYDTLQQWCMCMTDFSHNGHWIDHQGELLFVFSVSVTIMYRYKKYDDTDMGQTSDQVQMSLWIVTAWKWWMSYDREAEVSSYNAMSACKSTLESSGVGVQFDAYDMVWTAWNAKRARQ